MNIKNIILLLLFSCSVVSDSAILRTVAHQASLSHTISQSLLKLTSVELVMPCTISSSDVPFPSCFQSFPQWGYFLMNQLFASGGQSIGASASILLVNIQDWFPLGLTGLISLQSKALSRVFSNKEHNAKIHERKVDKYENRQKCIHNLIVSYRNRQVM